MTGHNHVYRLEHRRRFVQMEDTLERRTGTIDARRWHRIKVCPDCRFFSTTRFVGLTVAGGWSLEEAQPAVPAVRSRRLRHTATGTAAVTPSIDMCGGVQ